MLNTLAKVAQLRMLIFAECSAVKNYVSLIQPTINCYFITLLISYSKLICSKIIPYGEVINYICINQNGNSLDVVESNANAEIGYFTLSQQI